ncbi:MAG: phage tail protein [Nocardioidaceae bacterium]|nr:phage tail protein [Nocardioidaceae bacterium]
MADDLPFLGELRIFSYPQPPAYWLPCEGQELSIQKNMALFSLLGTMFGGNGSTTFLLPDLRGRVPIHVSGGDLPGTAGGELAHTLTTAEMPQHTHIAYGDNRPARTNIPSGTARLGNSQPGNLWGPPNATGYLNNETIGRTGDSQPHENRQPYIALTICIAISGIYPSQSFQEV